MNLVHLQGEAAQPRKVKRTIGSKIMAGCTRTANIIFLLMLVSTILSMQSLASEPQPIILRTAIEPKTEIWVGQRVDLQVDVLARDGWAQIKTARDFEVPGAYVVRLETQGTRLSETLSGHEYEGQRYELSLFPQQGGTISIPQINVDVEVRRWGAEGGTSSQRMKTPAVEFNAEIPPGSGDLQGIISTTELKAQQQWKPQSQKFKVGDAIKRTIELGATEISGMAFAPLVFPATSGLGIYPGEPVVEDSYSRGSLRGKRTESVTYVFEKKGSFELPEIVILWWDIGQKKLKRVVLPPLEVKISAVSGSGTGTTGEDGKQMRPSSLLLAVLLLVVLSGIAWRFRYAIRSRWQTWRVECSQTEKAHFQRLREACRKNDAKAAYNRLLTWLNHTAPDTAAATLKNFLEAAVSEKLSKEVDELERWLFKKPTGHDAQAPWRGEVLYRELTKWRNRAKRTKEKTLTGEAILAPLNPQ